MKKVWSNKNILKNQTKPILLTIIYIDRKEKNNIYITDSGQNINIFNFQAFFV